MEHPPSWAAEAVAAFLREQSGWRQAQAHRFPNDARNLNSARALEELADHVENLPDSDPSLQELLNAGAFDERRRFLPTDEGRRVVARFGFDWITTPTVLLQELARATWRARRSSTQKRTRMNATIATGEHALTENDRSTLSDIFTIAETHSRECTVAEHAYLKALKADPLASDHRGAWIAAIRKVHGAIADVALARVRAFGGIDLDAIRLTLEGGALEMFLRPLFEEAGIGDDFILNRTSVVGHTPSLSFRRDIATLLRESVELLGTMRRVGATPRHIHELEQAVMNARDLVDGIPTYAAILDDVIRFVRSLGHGGDPNMLLGTIGNGLKTILDDIVPEDRIDSGTDWERRDSLERVLTSANGGDKWAIDVLKARPHLAFFDELTRKWVEQVDSGRGPGIAAARDTITRTRRPSQ
jgi:hypothetical protein